RCTLDAAAGYSPGGLPRDLARAGDAMSAPSSQESGRRARRPKQGTDQQAGPPADPQTGPLPTLEDAQQPSTQSPMPRAAGILLHPTSLPGPHGIGDLGAAAYRFVETLEAARQTVW